ncbi:hypothetical protein [Phytohabitans suffuscus]|uniref:hypothetical protein n=1 Tax=Phytohabitans suffuscus TaxID=624315 RepID=UPI001564E622|nr:hypothetical protein [Phytohabitans suffuscus]
MDVTLRDATATDSDFCYALHEATLGPYVAAVWGWDDAAQRRFHRRGRRQARRTSGGEAPPRARRGPCAVRVRWRRR